MCLESESAVPHFNNRCAFGLKLPCVILKALPLFQVLETGNGRKRANGTASAQQVAPHQDVRRKLSSC